MCADTFYKSTKFRPQHVSQTRSDTETNPNKILVSFDSINLFWNIYI